jgi:glycosyltransferase involved in cell wall biosynthesis
MKIAIDVSPLSSGHKVRGVGSYVSLIKNNIEKYDKKNKYVFFEGKCPNGVDVVHYPYFDPFFPVLPFKKKVKTVVTVHDLTPIKFKKHFPSGIRGGLRWKYNKRLLKNADIVIVDSESSKDDVVNLAGINESKVKVVYLASNPIYEKLKTDNFKLEIKKKFDLPDNFMIYVGDVTWNKNLPRIIEAAKKADINLILIGKALAETNFDKKNPWNEDRVKVSEMIKNERKIRTLGFVSDEDLLKIYNMADALLMPSIYEGFGLPVLEAMSSGCPVITSREGSLPEVGGDAVLYVDANSVDAIVEGIEKLSKDERLREELSQKGLAQAEKFSPEKTMNNLVRIYNNF